MIDRKKMNVCDSCNVTSSEKNPVTTYTATFERTNKKITLCRDCYDCPNCGAQYVAQKRIKGVRKISDDLISRKALLGTERLLMTDIVQNNPTAKYILEQALYDIEHAETAFDKEKVIEKLKDQYNYSRKVCNKNDNVYFEYWEGRTDSYKDAIEIVEKGGIE